MNMRKYLLVFAMIVFFIADLRSQTSEQAKEMMELAEAAQNPIADMNMIPIQFNWYTGGGLGDQTMMQTLIQPVLPLPLTKRWNVVSRTVIALISMPVGGENGDRAKGIGDIQEQIYFTPTKKHKVIYGFGPVFSFPTSTNEVWATGQFAVGPNAVIVVMPGKWLVGAVANNLWRFAGSDNTTAINSFYFQYFVNYNFNKGWALGTAPSITANWNAPEGQQWTVPVGLNISKITVIGKQPLSLNIQYYYNVVRPDNEGSSQIRILVSFLFPKKME
jgi:hypothetical protein